MARHAQPAVALQLAEQLGGQPALADAGLPRDDGRARPDGVGPRRQVAQRGQLALATHHDLAVEDVHPHSVPHFPYAVTP